MLKKRNEKRVLFQKQVVCKSGLEMLTASSRDVSQHGIGIKTMQRMPLFQRVEITLLFGKESVIIEGETRWASEYSGIHDAQRIEVGISIKKPPENYLQLVAECNDRLQPRPAYETLYGGSYCRRWNRTR